MKPSKSDVPEIMKNSKVLAAIMVVLVGLLYAGSIGGPFLNGDISNIVENPGVHSLISPCGDKGCPAGYDLYGRPVVRISFALNYLAGKISPAGYHVVNLAIHIFSVLTLFAVVRLTLEKCPALSAGCADSASFLAFLAAILWGVHPLNTQAVAYLSGRLDSLPGLFFLVCLYGSARASFDEKPLLGNLVSAAAFLLGLGSGSTLLAAPFVVAAYQYFFAPRRFFSSLARSAFFYVACLAGASVFAYFSVFSEGPSNTGYIQAPSALEYAREQPFIIVRYLRLALFPKGLVFDYWWIPSTGYGFITFTCGIMAAFLAVVWGTIRRRAWAFVGFFFFAALSASSSFFPQPDFALESRMYLPLAALCVFFVMAVFRLGANRGAFAGKPVAAVGLIIVLALAGASFYRNFQYADAGDLWEDTVKKRPENPRAYTGLGSAFLEKGQFAKADERFKAAINIENRYAPAHFNMGNCFFAQNQAYEAIRHYRRAVLVDTVYWQAYANLGAALCTAGLWDEGVWSLEQASRINPFNQEIAANLKKARKEREIYNEGELDKLK